MKHPDRTTLFATLLLTISFSLFSSAPAAGQELSAAQIALIEAQAQRHVERYYNFYYERNPEALSTEIFTLPWYTPTGAPRAVGIGRALHFITHGGRCVVREGTRSHQQQTDHKRVRG